MKARIKATGEIIEVSQGIYSPYQYVGDNGAIYTDEEVEILYEVLDSTIDYWTRLEHQAAIAAMQGILSNPNIVYKDISTETICNHVAERVKEIAHALVEKLKKKEE